jgi:hypothetical protein
VLSLSIVYLRTDGKEIIRTFIPAFHLAGDLVERHPKPKKNGRTHMGVRPRPSSRLSGAVSCLLRFTLYHISRLLWLIESDDLHLTVALESDTAGDRDSSQKLIVHQ